MDDVAEAQQATTASYSAGDLHPLSFEAFLHCSLVCFASCFPILVWFKLYGSHHFDAFS
jgi:hypothetical protein